jgi:fluoroacetyl-CoA thioesterase
MAKATVIAGNAMFTVESSETTKAPLAAIHRVIARYDTRVVPAVVTAVARRAGLALPGPPTVQPDAMPLEPGAVHEVSRTVTPDVTADAMGNRGVQVFATPFVVALLEDAAGGMLMPTLPAGASTVGTMIEMRHLAPTPVGMAVRARATLLETDGRRYLFRVEAWDADEKIAEGRHERRLVPDLARFLERAMKKGQA